MMAERSLTLGEVVSIGIGGMIGGGIFAVLGLSVQLTRGGAPLAFLLSGIIALLTAYSYAKLSKRFPSKGGTIEFLVKAYGTGILSGTLNIFLLVSYIIMISLYAYAFGAYGATFFNNDALVMHILITLVILAFTLLNAFGARISGLAEELMVGFKVSILGLVAVAGLMFIKGSRLALQNWAGPVQLIAGGMIIFLAYEGFELIANAGGDIERTSDLPKAFYISVLSVIVIYVLIAIVTVGNLPFSEIISARDYALAEVARPALGLLGFVLVAIAALVSTSSAINATLYGTARASYMVAKYGELPKITERRVWKDAYEGLILISLFSLIVANTVDLETVSIAGSSGFLLVFLAVNIAALRLRKEVHANPVLVSLGIAGAISAFSVLLYYTYLVSPAELSLPIMLLVGSALMEVGYRAYTSREISRYIDHNLEEKERNIKNWRSWIPGLISQIIKEFSDAEVYLVGKLAIGETTGVSSVNLVVFTKNPPENKVESWILSKYLKHRAGLGKNHPIRIKYSRKSGKTRELEKHKDYTRVSNRKI